jgi:hypothetical protein
MCILIHHPVGTQFNQEQLLDFFSKNSDGFGAIVKRGDTVEVIKSIGTLQEIEDLYIQQVAGFEAIIHFRMKTHGKIDIANCHPYEVVPGVWMAHNGILSTGNYKDPSMSDTWHYIQDFLKPMLEHDVTLIHNEGFQKMVASHIGSSNKFGFMNQDGDVVLINEASGIWHEEVWYSNTYAWTPWKFGYGKRPEPVAAVGSGRYNYGSQYDYSGTAPRTTATATAAAIRADMSKGRYASSPSWKSWDKMDREIQAAQLELDATKPKVVKKKRGKGKREPRELTTEQLKRLFRASYGAVQLGFQGALEWIERNPGAAMTFIYEVYGSEDSARFNRNSVSNMVNHDIGEAADVMCDIWEEMEPELCEIAGIQLEGESKNV